MGLSADICDRYPHEFSGGQRQRIGIARALAVKPQLDRLRRSGLGARRVGAGAGRQSAAGPQDEFGLTYLFIAHDLAVVEHISTRVAVMYLGKIVELAPAKDLYINPRHPYSEALLSAVPVPDPTAKRRRIILEGDVPSPVNPPSGCRFHTRCALRVPSCSHNEQVLDRSVAGALGGLPGPYRRRCDLIELSVVEGSGARLVRAGCGIAPPADPDRKTVDRS